MKILIISSTNEKEEYIIPNCENIIKTTHFYVLYSSASITKNSNNEPSFFQKNKFLFNGLLGFKRTICLYLLNIFITFFHIITVSRQ